MRKKAAYKRIFLFVIFALILVEVSSMASDIIQTTEYPYPSWVVALDRMGTDAGHLKIEFDSQRIFEYEMHSFPQGSEQGTTVDLNPGDLFIVWDEDPGHGRDMVGCSFSGTYQASALKDTAPSEYTVVSTIDSNTEWTVYTVTGSGTFTVTETGLNEHEAVRLNQTLLDLTLEDNVDEDGCVLPGQEMTYTICWDNQLDPNENGQTFEDVYIIDYLPTGVTCMDGVETSEPNEIFNPISNDSYYDPNDHSYICYIGEIATGDSNCLTFSVVIDSDVEPGMKLSNTIEIWSGEFLLAKQTETTDICCQWEGIDPNLIYVDHAAKGASNGLSWQDAYTDLQDALYRAGTSNCQPENGFTIHAAQGTYSPGENDDDTFTLPDNVSIYGGFITGGSDFEYRNPDKYKTILNGRIDPNTNNRNKTVVTMGNNTLMDGFTITQADNYGVYGREVDFAIENCLVKNSRQLGIKAENCNVSVKWCKINNNISDGIYHIGQNYMINVENSVISNNNEHGFFIRFSAPTIKNCVVAKNGSATEDFHGINIYDPSGVPVLLNNTIAHNTKAGIYFYNDDPNFPNFPKVENCILWYNNNNQGQIYGHDPNYLKYNCIYDANDIDGTDYNLDYNYNFTGNPGFAYSDPNLYDDGSIEFNPHLAYNSPCIDMGNPLLDYTDQNDTDSESRIVGLYPDIGADEVYSCDGNLSEDDLYNEFDINADGIVNLWEFNLLSSAWMCSEPNHIPLDPPPEGGDEDDTSRYDPRCDFDGNWHVGNYDLALFADEWLWTAYWIQSLADRFSSEVITND